MFSVRQDLEMVHGRFIAAQKTDLNAIALQ